MSEQKPDQAQPKEQKIPKALLAMLGPDTGESKEEFKQRVKDNLSKKGILRDK